MVDFNGRVESSTNGCVGVHGGNGWRERNRDGDRLLDFSDGFDTIIGDTFFEKEVDLHLW